MAGRKKASPVPLKSLDELFGTGTEENAGIQEIALQNLHPFRNHPFKVIDDEKMLELVESIKEHGVLVPAIVRMRDTGGYELVSGHRRCHAARIAGIPSMPVIIKELTDDEATLIMVDSNIQREALLFSEKAFAYKMKYDALKRQGKRTDLTSTQLGKKSEGMTTAELMAEESEDSKNQILRYIRLTLLEVELLELVDIKKLPFNTAVELSYLKVKEQEVLLEYLVSHGCVPSLKQAQEMKKFSKEKGLTYQRIDEICTVQKSNSFQVQLPAKTISKYFPKECTKENVESIIIGLLEEWSKQNRSIVET